MTQKRRLYKVVDADAWNRAASKGSFAGSGIDLVDGFIHLSTSDQVRETVAKHFAGVDNLVMVEVAADPLGDSLRWEQSRHDELFPHVYGEISMAAVVRTVPLPIDGDGRHRFPNDL